MRDEGDDLRGAVLAEGVGGFGEGAAGVLVGAISAVSLGGRVCWRGRGEVGRGEEGICVPAMSSTRIAHLSLTFPTRVICCKSGSALSIQDHVLLLDLPSRPRF